MKHGTELDTQRLADEPDWASRQRQVYRRTNHRAVIVRELMEDSRSAC